MFKNMVLQNANKLPPKSPESPIFIFFRNFVLTNFFICDNMENGRQIKENGRQIKNMEVYLCLAKSFVQHRLVF
jgi:hypothetical protein